MNVHPVLQSVAAALATVIASLSLWHTIVIGPINSSISEIKVSQKETNRTVRTVEVNQAGVVVSIENLAKAIEGLANQIAAERRMHISNGRQSLVYPETEVAHANRN